MRKILLWMSASVAVCVVALQPAAMQSPPPVSATPAAPAVVVAPTQTVANVPVPTLTAEETAVLSRLAAARLSATREHVAGIAQRAVHDRDEQLFREPTAAEAAALALPGASSVAQEISVPVGGYAVKTDASGISLVVATVSKDGVSTRHDAKGGRRDR